MTAFSELSVTSLTVFAVCTIILLLGAIFLLVGTAIKHIGRKYVFFSTVLFVGIILIMQGILDISICLEGTYQWSACGNIIGKIPWAAVLALLIFFSTAQVLLFVIILRRRKNQLTAGAIKESLDALPDGVCFFALDGQPLLINKQMNRISGGLFDSEILNAEIFFNRIKEKDVSDRATVIRTEPNVAIETSDGKVWEFHLDKISVGKSEIYELLASDITDQYRLTLELKQRNERLNRVNERLRLFSEQMVTFTAEKELLDAKIKVHDNIGRSLLSFRKYLMQSKDERNRKELLFLWEYVVRVMKNETLPSDEWNLLEKTADMLGVTIEFSGEMPENIQKRTAIVTAIRECLTNTARHAKGDKLFINIKSHNGSFTADFTNNGMPPKENIHESGGLKNLRRIVERASGTMTVKSTPQFLLRLEFPKGEKIEWLKQEY